jgi:L-2,4-diaminobutyric acid acetyltransferase
VQEALSFRVPRASDGAALHQLVANCPPLDPNSFYCNLLQCSHFADTAVAVEYEGELVGFISGYIPPGKPDTLFVWQVAVDSSMRGQGLGGKMLGHLVDRTGVQWMETTVTPDNGASWGMFRSFARKRGAECEDCGPLFERDAHFGGKHDSEHLARLGPFTETSTKQAS